jgi:hypothetical protein
MATCSVTILAEIVKELWKLLKGWESRIDCEMRGTAAYINIVVSICQHLSALTNLCQLRHIPRPRRVYYRFPIILVANNQPYCSFVL